MTFPTTGLLDDFNRAGASTLGANWTGITSKDAGGILSNQATYAFGQDCRTQYNVSTFGPDCEVYYTINLVPFYWWMNVRGPTLGSEVGSYAYGALNGGTDISIYRVDSGSVYTQLGASVTQTTSAGDKGGMSAIGSTITGYFYTSGAWSQIIQRTDATYNTAGYLEMGSVPDGGMYGLTDDFSGGTVSSGTETTDSATSLLSLIPSSSDIAAYIDQNSQLLGLIPSSSDGIQHFDSAISQLLLSPSNVDIAQYVESQTCGYNLIPSNSDLANLIESATMLLNLTGSNSDIPVYSDAFTLPYGVVVSPADIANFVESTTLVYLLAISGIDDQTDSSTHYTDVGTLLESIVLLNSDIASFVDQNISFLGLIPSTVETNLYNDLATQLYSLLPSSVESRVSSDSGNLLLRPAPSTVDTISAIDLQTVMLLFLGSGTENAASIGDEALLTYLITVGAFLDIQTLVNLYGVAYNRYLARAFNRWVGKAW